MKSEELVSATETVLREQPFAPIISRDEASELATATVRELFERIVKVRGMLHHPNRKGGKYWSPEKPRRFATETLVLSFICSRIAMQRAVWMWMNPRVKRGVKNVRRGLRTGNPIRVVTR